MPSLGIAMTLASVLSSFGASNAPLELIVSAGAHDRQDAIARAEWPLSYAPSGLGNLGGGIVVLHDAEASVRQLAQVDRLDRPDRIRITWPLAGKLAAGTERTYRMAAAQEWEGEGPWSLDTESEARILLRHDDRIVFRYNASPVSHADFPHPNQPRDAYIHPAFSPSGALITGDYSKLSHAHHRGFFFAYTKTSTGDLHPDFWNIQSGTGKVRFERLESHAVGVVTARFTTNHSWEATGADGKPVQVLAERWDVEAFDVPGSPYWLIDLTVTQRAVGRPMVLPLYRYGGMAYRGPDSFFPKGVLDVLTSDGLDRVTGDQKPARWVDLTGPVAEGSSDYAGALVMDHPDNPHHPTPARIHPTTIPFVCFTPSHDRELTIGTDSDTVLRYRIAIHDGRPDNELNARLWRDFAAPVSVRTESGAPADDRDE